MKYNFAILFFGLLQAKGSNCDADECLSGDVVELDLLPQIFQRAADEFPVPTLEFGDRSAATFQKMFNKAVVNYGQNLYYNVYIEAKDIGDRFVHDIRRLKRILQESINSEAAHGTESTFMDGCLQQLTDELELFMDLRPGTKNFKSAKLPTLPEQQIKLQNRTTRRTPKELFLHFEETIDDIVGRLYAYVTSSYINAWRSLRSGFTVSRMQFYNEILNGEVLVACQQVVKEVNEQSDVIQRHVSSETWQSFKLIARHISEISIECRAPHDKRESCV